MLAIGFDQDARFEGKIMDELASLERHETIRILDLLFVGKDAETGDLLALDHQGKELGAIVGALLGFVFEGEQPSEVSEIEGHAFGLSQREIQGIAASLKPSSSAGFLLIEHVWARDLKRAIRETGGFPFGEGFPHPRDPRRSRYRATRHVRDHRGTRDEGGGRRGVGRIKQVEPTKRKEKIDGTHGSTSRRPDGGAAELPNHGAHAATSLVRPGQAGDEGGLQ